MQALLLDAIKTTRANALNLISDLSVAQLNHVPENFNNNIIWNLAHMVVTQELLTYGLSGLKGICPPELIEAYKKGTKPQAEAVSAVQIEEIKTLLTTSVDRFAADYEKGIFKTFKTYPTSYNITLESIDDAILFNNIHEGLHLGSILALKKLV